jgi:hypothetical protein
MNHIHKLQNEVTDLNDQIVTRAERIQEFREHLALPKFNTAGTDGERTDWISIQDVRRWLQYIETV